MVNFAFVFLGLLGFLIAHAGWKHPERCLGGRYGIWVKLLGENTAKAFAKYVGAPLCALFSLAMLLMGILGF